MRVVCTRLSYPFCFMISQPRRSTPFFHVTFSTPVVLEIDLLFAVGTFSSNADNVFQKFQETITFAIDTYGTKSIHFTIFAGSSDDTIIYFDNYTTAKQLKTLLQALVANLLDETLWKARTVFKSSSALEGAQKVFVLTIVSFLSFRCCYLK